jgi:hypothetical protein
MAAILKELLDGILQDSLAVSLAQAMAAANKRAQEAGVDASQSRISVTQQHSKQGLVWRIYYGHQNPVGRRGGGLTVDVASEDATVRQVLRGQ